MKTSQLESECDALSKRMFRILFGIRIDLLKSNLCEGLKLRLYTMLHVLPVLYFDKDRLN